MATETQTSDASSAGSAAEPVVHILWMNGGLGCDGDSVELTAATQPSIEEIALGALPGLPKIAVHWPLIDFECGPEQGAEHRLADLAVALLGERRLGQAAADEVADLGNPGGAGGERLGQHHHRDDLDRPIPLAVVPVWHRLSLPRKPGQRCGPYRPGMARPPIPALYLRLILLVALNSRTDHFPSHRPHAVHRTAAHRTIVSTGSTVQSCPGQTPGLA